MNKILHLIQKDLKNLGNPSIAKHSQRFFKTGEGEYGQGDKFLGIRVPVLRNLSRKYKEINLNETLQLLKSPWHEQRLLSLFILINLFQKGDEKQKEKIYIQYKKTINYINNWDLVDSSADKIIGDYLFSRDKKPLYKMAESKNLWERRIAIISTFYFIKQSEFHDALKISSLLLNDKEDLIHKAVGWMLREIGNRHFQTEEDFLKKHYKIMPRTMLRYAIEKFPEKLRKMYLKGDK